MERDIVCVDIPDFEVALHRLNDTSLRHRPVGIVSGSSSRATVLEVSSEARDEGLLPGMSLVTAGRLSRAIRWRVHNPTLVHEAQHELESAVSHITPHWEDGRPGQIVLDLTADRRRCGPPTDTAMRLHREVRTRYGLTAAVGMATNKLVSRVAASMVSPPQLCDVQAGSEAVFVAPAQLAQFPGWSSATGRQVYATLWDLNLRTFGDVAAVPLSDLELVTGKVACLLHQWAHGVDHSNVWPRHDRPSVSVTLGFEEDEIDVFRIGAILRRGVDELCRRLRRQQRVCGRVCLSLEAADHQPTSSHAPMVPASFWEVDLLPVVQQLMARCTTRRVRIRSGELRVEALTAPAMQLSLYDTPDTRQHARHCRLSLALDGVRQKYGAGAIQVGAVGRVQRHADT